MPVDNPVRNLCKQISIYMRSNAFDDAQSWIVTTNDSNPLMVSFRVADYRDRTE